MNKLSSEKITDFLNNFENIETQVLSNLYHEHNNNLVLQEWSDFKQDGSRFLILTLAQRHIESALEQKYGKPDYEIEGIDKTYKNYLLEHEGLTFIASIKSEVVRNRKINIEDIISFEKELIQLAVDYIAKNPDKITLTSANTFNDLKKEKLIDEHNQIVWKPSKKILKP